MLAQRLALARLLLQVYTRMTIRYVDTLTPENSVLMMFGVVIQFKYYFIYILLVFVTVTLRKCYHSALSVVLTDALVTEVYYLNMALALFNTGESRRYL